MLPAIASGGEIIPPNKNPSANVKSGIIALETNATAAEVQTTNPNANKLIGRFNFQKSFHEVFHAAAYNKGGRNIRNTRSGFRGNIGHAGIRLISSPGNDK